MGLPEDEIALTRFRQGDRRGAIELLMQVHEQPVFAYCVRTVRDRQLSEDIAQQVFLEVYRDLGSFRGTSSLRSWLIGIAHHRCQDAIKSGARRAARIELDDEAVVGHEDPSTSPTDQLDLTERAAALEDCLQALPAQTRETVLLRFQAEMSYEEMATVLGKKADTLCVRVARALPLLKRCLEGKGFAP